MKQHSQLTYRRGTGTVGYRVINLSIAIGWQFSTRFGKLKSSPLPRAERRSARPSQPNLTLPQPKSMEFSSTVQVFAH